MTFNISVQDGTHAGWRRIKADNVAFDCPNCNKFVAKHFSKCPDCGVSPPERG